MKVLFVSANTEQFNMPAMPLGLACVVQAARDAGHAVSLLDLMFEMDAEVVLQTIIAEFQPECICISVRNIDDQQMESPVFLLDKVKGVVAACRIFSDAPVVLGGAGYSIFPESALTFLEADMGIEGEGENALLALLSRLESGHDPAGIPGLYIRGCGVQSPKAFARRLDDFTLPDTGILSCSASKNRAPWIPVQTRRGVRAQVQLLFHARH